MWRELICVSVYVAGLVLKKLLSEYPDKVTGQEKVSDQKAKIIYDALDSHKDIYHVSVRVCLTSLLLTAFSRSCLPQVCAAV